ncbi:MAG: hypothetical protein ABIR66_10545 [Saprospiraceae bacterium]
MSTDKKKKKSSGSKHIKKSITKLPGQKAGGVKVIPDKKPFAKKDQVIHPRVKLPDVTRGPKVPDKTPSPPIDINIEE